MPYPLPANEAQRMERLRLYKVLDTPPESAFDSITRLAAAVLDVPIALISLIDEKRQWFKSRVGLGATETPREMAFCAHAIMKPDVFVVPDATKNDLFNRNPLVLDDPHIRFYAGAPLTTEDGLRLGTVCVIDRQPREITAKQEELLKDLSKLVVDELELRVAGRLAVEEIAERKRIEQMKNAFVSDVNHELRTPLTSIIGSLGLMKSGAVGPMPDQAQKVLDVADRNASQLLQLINDLLDAAKLDAGKMEFDLRPLDLQKLITESVENIAGYASKRGIEFKVHMHGPAIVQADYIRLMQVMNNLLSNAAKFAPEQSVVDVVLAPLERTHEVAVIDRGPGVPAAIRDRLFTKFVQDKSPGKSGIAGTGLGLSIAKAIIEGHAGEIDYRPEPGAGARFFFRLPQVF